MAYATGETPEVGDYVKNQWEQLGTVTRVHATQGALERINPAGLTFPWRLRGIYATLAEELLNYAVG
jgi:hypothetical protein